MCLQAGIQVRFTMIIYNLIWTTSSSLMTSVASCCFSQFSAVQVYGWSLAWAYIVHTRQEGESLPAQ